MKKYECTEEVKILYGITLHRIRALKSFSDVVEGQTGGWIESEKNLSQNGNAWVYDDAKVHGNARVCDDARVCGRARVCDGARVCGNALVCGRAQVCGRAWVDDDAWAYKKTHILTIGLIGRRSDTATFFRDKDNEITVRCGCFCGKLEAFLVKVEQTHGDNMHGKVYRLAAEMAKEQIIADSRLRKDHKGDK